MTTSAKSLARRIPHLSLLGVAALMVVVASVRHVSTPEALRIAFDETADPDERSRAMHVAACRATEPDRRPLMYSVVA